jgi:hypothetical protein
LDSARALHCFDICFGDFIDFCPTYAIIFQKAWMARTIKVTVVVYLTIAISSFFP